jgi:hypothetical protein
MGGYPPCQSLLCFASYRTSLIRANCSLVESQLTEWPLDKSHVPIICAPPFISTTSLVFNMPAWCHWSYYGGNGKQHGECSHCWIDVAIALDIAVRWLSLYDDIAVRWCETVEIASWLVDQIQLVPLGGDSGPRRDHHGTNIFCNLHLGPMSSASWVSRFLRPADNLNNGKFFLDFIRQCK